MTHDGIAAIEEAVAGVRKQVSDLHAELTRYNLVVWTGGNISGRVPGHDLFVIKPSGVGYDDLTPDTMVVCDLDGNVIRGTTGSERAPSSDTATHAYVYRHMPDVGGVVHTHSDYATAWAARREPIPCVITAMADEFGGEIPVGPFAIIGDDSIGRGIVETLTGHRSRAVLMANHGPFTIGKDAKDAKPGKDSGPKKPGPSDKNMKNGSPPPTSKRVTPPKNRPTPSSSAKGRPTPSRHEAQANKAKGTKDAKSSRRPDSSKKSS